MDDPVAAYSIHSIQHEQIQNDEVFYKSSLGVAVKRFKLLFNKYIGRWSFRWVKGSRSKLYLNMPTGA
jgi:hypothetical protein